MTCVGTSLASNYSVAFIPDYFTRARELDWKSRVLSVILAGQVVGEP